MPTRVKICGITRLEDARLAVDLGAAALGFNFFPPSPRYITPAAARAIVEKLPPLVMAVGVFANDKDAKRVATMARQAGVAAVQLHGAVLPKTISALADFRIIRAVSVKTDSSLDDVENWKAAAYLLDGFDVQLLGGTGRTFNWKLAAKAKEFGPIILAGGLTSANVGEAIRTARPFAVDVASGVEFAPGKKDPAKLRAFFAAVAKADKSI